MAEKKTTLSGEAAALMQGGYPIVEDLEETYGSLSTNDPHIIQAAAGEMKGRRLGSAARIAYEALIDLQDHIAPIPLTQTYSPDSDVYDALDDIATAISTTNSQFKEALGEVMDTQRHPEFAHIASPYLWMAEFDDIMNGIRGRDPATDLQDPVSIPFEFTVADLLINVIPEKWDESFPDIPLTLGKLFEIAFARSTGHVLSRLAGRDFRQFIPMFAAITLFDGDGEPYALNPNVFAFDTAKNCITLREDILQALTDAHLTQIDETLISDLNDQSQGPELGCIMNASSRVFDEGAPSETLMTMYYHMLLTNVQRSLYAKAS